MTVNHAREDMSIVIVGHVDHGKSTIIGHLLADTKSLPEGKLEQVREQCRRNARPFEYAFLLDALKDEQAQGITIDSARCFFKTKKRNYIIIDAPGHIEFLKNMVTGASRAEAALLVIDASEGVQENSRRHGYMLSMLGIRQVAVLINKMDLIQFDEKKFTRIVEEYSDFLKKIEITPTCFIPVSGYQGDNIANASKHMPWYHGPTVLDVLDGFITEIVPENQPFRMPVQGVYKFTRDGDSRRIVAGTVESGKLRVGDEVVFYPSGKKSIISSIEAFNREKQMEVGTGYATGFTLQEQIYVTRGELAVIASELKPRVTTRIRVNLFWLGKDPMQMGKTYQLKIGTAKVGAKIAEINRVIDASNLNYEKKDRIERHEVAECILELDKAVAFDVSSELAQTSRFVIVDRYEISGGGNIQDGLDDKQSWIRDKVMLRNFKWEKSLITDEERAEKYNQKSVLILITGKKDVGKKRIAKALEKKLFDEGKIVYFIGIGNVLYGVDADIKGINNHRMEHLRRLSEVSHLMLDAGAILIVTAVDLTNEELELMKTTLNPEKIETVWVGDDTDTDLAYRLYLPIGSTEEEAAGKVKGMLQERGIIFKP